MSEDNKGQNRDRRWWDTILSAQGIAIFLAGCLLSGTDKWFGTIERISKLESREAVQDDRMARIEQSQQQDRIDNKEQWRQVAAGMKEQGEKLDKLRDMLIQNSAGARPEIKRWTK